MNEEVKNNNLTGENTLNTSSNANLDATQEVSLPEFKSAVENSPAGATPFSEVTVPEANTPDLSNMSIKEEPVAPVTGEVANSSLNSVTSEEPKKMLTPEEVFPNFQPATKPEQSTPTATELAPQVEENVPNVSEPVATESTPVPTEPLQVFPDITPDSDVTSSAPTMETPNVSQPDVNSVPNNGSTPVPEVTPVEVNNDLSNVQTPNEVPANNTEEQADALPNFAQTEPVPTEVNQTPTAAAPANNEAPALTIPVMADTTAPEPTPTNVNNTSAPTNLETPNLVQPEAVTPTTEASAPVTQNEPAPNQVNNSINQNAPLSPEDEELLKAFVGKNYEKISTRPFNFAGFFFNTFYLFYRKMFLYGLVLFIIQTVLSVLLSSYYVTIYLVIDILVGLFINKFYLKYAKDKINKIKASNSGLSADELKNKCASAGGTSLGKVFLGFITQVGITLLILAIMVAVGLGSLFTAIINPANWNITNGDGGTLVEDVTIDNYVCVGSCTVTIENNGTTEDYVLNEEDKNKFTMFSNYSDYLKINIYYTEALQKKYITKYEVYLKSTGEDISNVTTEKELRTKIGLYTEGTYTDTFTLKSAGIMGVGSNSDNETYSYMSYTFTDENDIEYEMKYIVPEGASIPRLVVGNSYNLTFDVVLGTFDYEYTITSIN